MEISDSFKDKLLFILSILAGTVVGLLSVILCNRLGLVIFGFNLNLIISPLVAGFVETFVSRFLRNKTTGAISSIILFFYTNAVSWIFPATPIKFNIFTVGGFLIMLQAAFPLVINYIIIAILTLLTYLLGLIGGRLAFILTDNTQKPVNTTDVEIKEYDVSIFNNQPELHISNYYGMVFAEQVLHFESKELKKRIEFMGSDAAKKNLLRKQDYEISREYIYSILKEEAYKLGANAVIDVELEFTNYNQEMPPDVLIAAYGTAVSIDKNNL